MGKAAKAGAAAKTEDAGDSAAMRRNEAVDWRTELDSLPFQRASDSGSCWLCVL